MNKLWQYLLAISAIVCLLIYFGPQLYELSTNRVKLDLLLDSLGVWAPAMFVILTAAQVVIAPIPAVALGLAGGYFFGFTQGLMLNVLGLFIGSMLVFVLTKRLGRPLVEWALGEKQMRKAGKLLQGKGLLAVALVFLLPFMPDDALCFLAALTPMRTRVFAFLVLTCRTPGIVVASLTGSGVIALPWYGWALVGSVVLLVLYYAWRKQEHLERFIARLGATES